MTVYKLDVELNDLKLELLKMFRFVEEMIEQSIKALLERDEELAKKVYEADTFVDQAELDIERHCMKIMLKMQPVAKDFREVSTVLKVITDIERIGDQASDIAGIVPQISDNKVGCEKTHLPEMGRLAVEMVRDSVNSFIRQDVELAEKTIKADDIMDSKFEEVKQELINEIKENSAIANDAIMFMMIVKYLERIGDHAVNVCEWTDYNNSGEHRKF